MAAPRLWPHAARGGRDDGTWGVILVSLDTVRADLLDVYGGEAETAPNRPSLFDLSSDPGESRDLSSAHPGLAERIHASLVEMVSRLHRLGQPPSEMDTDGTLHDTLSQLGYAR